MPVNAFMIRLPVERKSVHIVKSDDVTLKQQMQIIEGSRMLCGAILKTKKLYRKMSRHEINAAIEYAHNVNVVSMED